jgi:hypothetical protein
MECSECCQLARHTHCTRREYALEGVVPQERVPHERVSLLSSPAHTASSAVAILPNPLVTLSNVFLASASAAFSHAKMRAQRRMCSWLVPAQRSPMQRCERNVESHLVFAPFFLSSRSCHRGKKRRIEGEGSAAAASNGAGSAAAAAAAASGELTKSAKKLKSKKGLKETDEPKSDGHAAAVDDDDDDEDDDDDDDDDERDDDTVAPRGAAAAAAAAAESAEAGETGDTPFTVTHVTKDFVKGSPETLFSTLAGTVSDKTLKAIEENGWTHMMEIQVCSSTHSRTRLHAFKHILPPSLARTHTHTHTHTQTHTPARACTHRTYQPIDQPHTHATLDRSFGASPSCSTCVIFSQRPRLALARHWRF